MKELGCDSSLEGRIGKDGTPSDPYYWSADALADQNPELSERRNAISRIENPELVALHLLQEAVIDFPHHLSGTQGLAIASGRRRAVSSNMTSARSASKFIRARKRSS